jgi:hypothetical protein
MTRFSTEKSNIIKLLVLSTILLLLGLSVYLCFINPIINAESIIVLVISGLIIFLFAWIWFGTYYQLFKDRLIVTSGPFIWVIKIKDINYLRLNQMTFVGMYKATLSTSGIEIKYKKRRSLFISPMPQHKFIEKLKELDNRIEIKER